MRFMRLTAPLRLWVLLTLGTVRSKPECLECLVQCSRELASHTSLAPSRPSRRHSRRVG